MGGTAACSSHPRLLLVLRLHDTVQRRSQTWQPKILWRCLDYRSSRRNSTVEAHDVPQHDDVRCYVACSFFIAKQCRESKAVGTRFAGSVQTIPRSGGDSGASQRTIVVAAFLHFHLDRQHLCGALTEPPHLFGSPDAWRWCQPRTSSTIWGLSTIWGPQTERQTKMTSKTQPPGHCHTQTAWPDCGRGFLPTPPGANK